MHTFETPRLRMRPLDESDQGIYCALYTDPALMRFIAAPLEAERARRSFHAALGMQAPRPQRWIVTEKAGGDVGLLGLIGTGDRPEIGVMLLASAQGRGYGTEAMAGMVAHAFAAYDLQAVCAHQAVVDNPTVVRLMTRLRFRTLAPTAERPAGGDWELWRREVPADYLAAVVLGVVRS
jgi:RimJ/RimL family protein N-acetyltransferase